MNDQSLYNWLKVAFSYGVGPATMLKLIQHMGSVEEILSSSLQVLTDIAGRGIAQSIISNKSLVEVDKALSWKAAKPESRQILTLESKDYPPELAVIANPPMVLFAEGKLSLLSNKKIAIVGTRHPTSQGIENARMFAKDIAAKGLTVVSGLAAGIDRYAHEGAIDEVASTIGVIGNGIDLIYPSSNRDMYDRLITQGLILSEFPLGTNPVSSNFPRRNRTIVGLSQACLVIESGLDGGSMISANFALEMGREVMAIPGSIHNPMARGCHKLIKSGAKLVETSHDIFEDLQLTLNAVKTKKNSKDTATDPVLLAMGYDSVSIDNLCAKLEMDFSDLCGRLLELELSGKIVNCGGGRYQRIFN